MIFEKVKTIVMDQLMVDDYEVTIDSSFKSLGADSIDIIEIIMELEGGTT